MLQKNGYLHGKLCLSWCNMFISLEYSQLWDVFKSCCSLTLFCYRICSSWHLTRMLRFVRMCVVPWSCWLRCAWIDSYRTSTTSWRWVEADTLGSIVTPGRHWERILNIYSLCLAEKENVFWDDENRTLSLSTSDWYIVLWQHSSP